MVYETSTVLSKDSIFFPQLTTSCIAPDTTSAYMLHGGNPSKSQLEKLASPDIFSLQSYNPFIILWTYSRHSLTPPVNSGSVSRVSSRLSGSPLKGELFDRWIGAMDLTTTILLILSILLIPLVMTCTSVWFYLYADKVRSKERYWFKVQSAQLRQAAAAEAGENPGTLGSAPSRSLTLRPDEVPQEDHMESLVLDGDQVIELRQSSKASMCSTIPNGSQVSSGENDERTLARAGSKQSVTKKKSRSHSKQSRSGSKTSSRPEPQLQRGRSLSEGQLQVSQGGRTLGEELAFRDSAAEGHMGMGQDK